MIDPKQKSQITQNPKDTILTKDEILDYLSEIKPYLEKVGIKKIGLFGSYAKDYADENSDIDIVVLADEKEFLDKLGVYEALEYLDDLEKEVSIKFKKPVDICHFYSNEKMQKNKIVKGAIYV
ncbi:MAG: nucleotidyltransferase domain-containing protein [Campylobacter sp.]|nr:nucleotidyltransferase domain-containing protein [Campylobacter sp.]